MAPIILLRQREPTLTKTTTHFGNTDMAGLKADIERWSTELGFQRLGVSDIDLAAAEARLSQWLDAGFTAAWTTCSDTERSAVVRTCWYPAPRA